MFLAQPDTILFQAANKTFFCLSGSYNRSFTPGEEILSGRNEASPEACSPDTANGYASENDAFSFCLVSKTLEKNGSMLPGKVTSQDHFTAMQLELAPLAPLELASEKFIRQESEVIFDRQQ